MTICEFCECTNLSYGQVHTLLNTGLISPDMPSSQVERARLVKALSEKGVKLSAIARSATVDFDRGSFLVFDGSEVRPYPDARTAISAIVRAKRSCCAVEVVGPQAPKDESARQIGR